jgi:CxxC motif-containing protein
MIEVVVGRKIPLTLQVYDGNASLKVVSNLFDKFGKEYLSAELLHIKNGLYVNFEIDMPDQDLIIAQYQTDKPDDYELAQDVFKSIPKSIPEAKIMVGEVVSKGLWDDENIIIGEAYVDKEDENT